MGAWGTGSFDNDDAMDWVGGLADGGFDVGQQWLATVDELLARLS